MPQSAEAKDFMAFLRSVGNSIAHPQKHPPKHTKPAHPPNRSGSNTARQPTQPQQETSPAPADMSRDTAEVQSAPSPAPTIVPEPVVRSASASALTGGRRDLPYAVPMPNKPGFVTSPYAPRAGLVDVRGFPSGTEVKDPYTGKVFLTP
ncbi:MAG: hypothetical protein ACJ8LI_07395 [Chthoniobacterales bacterium]